MKRVLAAFVTLLIVFSAFPGGVICEDEDMPSCGGTNRIEINDPAELKGEPNDIKRVTLEIFRTRDSAGKQVRKIDMQMEVHSRYYAKPPEICAILFTLRLTDTTGKTGVVQDSIGIQSFPGTGIFRFSDKDQDFSIIEDIEESNKIKLVCANVQFIMGTFNTETKVFNPTDETEWSDKMVDFADTTQPQNPTDLKAENEYGCIKISWAKPQKSSLNMEIDHYRFYKDGKFIKKLESTATYYKDCDIEAGGSYKYSICAVSPWLVEGPKAPINVTYMPVAKVLPDKDSIDFGFVETERLKPIKVKLTNYGDIDADVKLEPSDDWIAVNPSTLKIEKSKRTDIEISVDQSKVKPNASYEGTIKITWGTTDFQMISVVVRIKPDTTPPEITVDPITEVSNQLQYTITGIVEPGASVWVNNVAATIEGDKFKATINIIPAPSLTNVEVKATDKNNNTIKKNIGKIVNILSSNVVLVIGSEKMTVNGKDVVIKPAPTIISGKTLVPLRAVADAFGASVNWDAASKTATIVLREKTIQITLDKDTAIINGEPKAIGSKAINLGGRVMVPFRFIAEALGAKVDYNAETKSIMLILVVRP